MTASWSPPMLATNATLDDVVGAGAWLFERKLDGLRCLGVRDGNGVELWSRNHLTFTARFPTLRTALAALDADRFVIDGEIVAFDGERTSFGLLGRPGTGTAIGFVAFDLLHLLGSDTTSLPIEDRRRLLGLALEGAPPSLTFSAELTGDAPNLLAEACQRGWEGLMAKQRGSAYQGGRTRSWRKLKCVASQELVIGGWTEPQRTRSGLGALLVGYHDATGLRYAGRVGTGFSEAMLGRLATMLGEREMERSPFVDPIRLRVAHWARPDLVAAVGFSEWTADGKLRHPRFEGLRPDVDPAAVVRDPPPPGRQSDG